MKDWEKKLDAVEISGFKLFLRLGLKKGKKISAEALDKKAEKALKDLDITDNKESWLQLTREEFKDFIKN